MKQFNRIVSVYSPDSTRYKKHYRSYVWPRIVEVAKIGKLATEEVALKDKSFDEAVKEVVSALHDGDALIAAGGDGIVSVALNATLNSDRHVFFGALALGTANDFSSATTGKSVDPARLLMSDLVNYHPLELRADGKHIRYAAQELAFGAADPIIGFLNSKEVRRKRKDMHGLMPLLAAYIIRRYNTIGREVLTDKEILIPHFRRNGSNLNDSDNIIAFTIGTIGNIMRPQPGNMHLLEKDFFYHASYLYGQASKDVPTLMKWLVTGFPGEITKREMMRFDTPAELRAQVDGEQVVLPESTIIEIARSERSLSLLCPRKAELAKSALAITQITSTLT